MNGFIIPQVERLQSDFGLFPVTASEIEFYLIGSDENAALPVFWDAVRAACAAADIPIFNIEKERGREQHEVSLAPCNDAVKTARDTQSLIDIIKDKAPAHGLEASFSAKPFADQPGSGLHIHVHLADAQRKNVFYKDDATMSDALKFSIGGLLAMLPDCMTVFAPNPESYARFAPGGNAPLTVSWGANNRTTAVRLPDAAHDNKHIEHRVAGADADPERVIAAILAAMHYGLKNRSDPGPQIYGDAALPIYRLARLPASLEEAKTAMRQSTLYESYFPHG